MRSAFSLVELSIVLVILGLLTGGILAGQSLIRAAELRSVGTDYQRFTAALGAFRDKYFSVPGDMSNATSFWGTAGTCPGTNASPSTTAATCNGDGNGNIRPDATNANELFRAWHHLANSGLVEGSYTGVSGSATATDPMAVPGTNVPRGRLSNTGWTLYSFGSATTISSTGYFENNYGNFLFFGAPGATNVTFYTAIKPEEAWNIDTKLDDGKPATGMIVTRESDGGGTSTSCTDLAPSNAVSLTASNYMLTNNGPYCSFLMKTGY